MSEIGHGICKSKKQYATAAVAKDVSDLAFIQRRIMLRWYECQYCGAWHLTSKSLQNYEKRLRQFGAKREPEVGG